MDERENKDEKDENEAVSVEGGCNTKNSKGKQKNNFTAKKPFLNIIQYLQQVRYKFKYYSFRLFRGYISPFYRFSMAPFYLSESCYHSITFNHDIFLRFFTDSTFHCITVYYRYWKKLSLTARA
jgi:hypothetical protein